MKLNIDFDNKVITLLDKVNIDALSKAVKKMFPETWKEFTLDTNTSVVYSYYPHYYWYNGYYTGTPTFVSGTTETSTAISASEITVSNYNYVPTPENVITYKGEPSVLNIAEPIVVNTITSGTYCIEVGDFEIETT